MTPQYGSPEQLLFTQQDSVACLTLNRPAQYNALSTALLNAIIERLDIIAADETIAAVVLRANGKAFCAGHDLKELRRSADRADHHALFRRCSEMMQKLIALPQPVIAQVQGMATAAGCQLVATSDLAIAAENATFAVSGIRAGLFCSTPAVALSRNVSRKRALELLLTGEFIDAQTALEYGLLNQVTRADALGHAVDKLVKKIIRHPRRVVGIGKAMFYRQLEENLSTAYEHASGVIADNIMLAETLEGIDAFIEKRPPDWQK